MNRSQSETPTGLTAKQLRKVIGIGEIADTTHNNKKHTKSGVVAKVGKGP